ncbi:MAG: NAD(P)H-dependent oxidoreductase [Acidobacteriota bacterium]|nr:NAD(P)H-dependent oxidoreductase [Acidobacteriota bacterium]
MTQRKILVLFAHPQFSRSVANARIAREARDLDGVTFIDLYAAYPRFEIDVDLEQERLKAHDLILFQHPLYWYSTPSIMKEWQDLVLEYGFAYGADGHALDGKYFLNAITTGGAEQAFTRRGYQHFHIRELLTPLEQTATLCRMHYLPPYVLYAAGHAVEENRLEPHAEGYRRLLIALRDNRLNIEAAMKVKTLNGHLDELIEGAY